MLRSHHQIGTSRGRQGNSCYYSLWVEIAPSKCQSKVDLIAAAEESQSFMARCDPRYRRLLLTFTPHRHDTLPSENGPDYFLILDHVDYLYQQPSLMTQILTWPKFWLKFLPKWLSRGGNYSRLPEQHAEYALAGQNNPRPMHYYVQVILYTFVTAALVYIILYTSPTARSWPEDGWIRYPTGDSDGPKRQLRIHYHNATEWSVNNPHDHGEWRIRIDDQAIIPAELYDDDEDRYQQWFIQRYPEMHEVVQTKSYIRPSWLGSLQIQVPWDEEFHMAHCVMAFRRYWKARESGTHVCSRDIDHNHIKHCIDRFDKQVFPPGPRTDYGEYSSQWVLWWQTKVCF